MKTFRDKVNESAEFIKSKITAQPEIGMVLGSGLGVLAEEVEEKKPKKKSSKRTKKTKTEENGTVEAKNA